MKGIAMNCPRCGANGTWKAVPTWMAECENGHLFVPRKQTGTVSKPDQRHNEDRADQQGASE